MGKLYCHTPLFFDGREVLTKGKAYEIHEEDHNLDYVIFDNDNVEHIFTRESDHDGMSYRTWFSFSPPEDMPTEAGVEAEEDEEEAWIPTPKEEEDSTAPAECVIFTDLQSEIEHEIRAVLQEMQSARRRGAVSEYRTYASTLVKLSTLINL